MPGNPLEWVEQELDRLQEQQLLRTLRVRESPVEAQVIVTGQRLWNLASNDYLGLAADERLIRAANAACALRGWGSGASPLVTGRSPEHAECERRLARFEGTEAALLFPTGFAANMGTISALVGPGDLVLSDARNHASIIDGCRLSRAQVVVYPHADVDAVHAHLQQAQSMRRRLIVTDSLFSMDGNLAPLPALAELAERYQAMLMVDEAHATGVLGAGGRGACEALGVEQGVPIRVGTLSKALGSLGGFVAGSQALIDYLAQRARSYVFSSAAPPATAAAAIEALAIVQNEPQRRRQLAQRAAWLRQTLTEQRWDVGSSQSHIVPLIVGPPERAVALSAALAQNGWLVPAIRPPSVPAGRSRLRLSLTCLIPDDALECLAGELARLAGRGSAGGCA
jgi:8-amino-7-oxononanoate synthase